MRTNAFGVKSAFDSAASTALSRGKERLRRRPPPAATVAFTNVPRVSLWVEKIEAMDQSPSGRAGGLLDRGADAHVGAAPANVSSHGRINVGILRLGCPGHQSVAD